MSANKAAIASLSLLLAGCSGIAKQRALVLETAGKPREALALADVSRLRGAFNRGACQSIFDKADQVFRLRQSQHAWLSECERLRKKMGSWQSFRARVEHGPGVPLSVVVFGEAEFANGRWRTRTQVETVWHFDHGRAELFSLFWNGETIPMRAPSRPRDRYMDPPPKRYSEPA